MLFCHPQPESYQQLLQLQQQQLQHSTSYIRDALAPFLKTEEARLRADSGARRPPFHYVLCAATSPAVKQQEETLTYLNQEHRAHRVSRPPAAVHGAPASGGMEVEPPRRPDPGYRCSPLRGDPGPAFRPSAPQHHRVPLGSLEERFCLHPGPLHQHRVHPQEARRGEGRAVLHPGGLLHLQRPGGIRGTRSFVQLPGQGLQAQRSRSQAEDRQREDGEEDASGPGQVPAVP